MSHIIRDTVNKFVKVEIPNDSVIAGKMSEIMTNKYTLITVYLFILYLLIKHYKWKILLIAVLIFLIFAISYKADLSVIKPVADYVKPYIKNFFNNHVTSSLNGFNVDNVKSYIINNNLANSFGVTSFVSILLKKKCGKIKLLFMWPIVSGILKCMNDINASPEVLFEGILGSFIGLLSFKSFKFVEKYI